MRASASFLSLIVYWYCEKMAWEASFISYIFFSTIHRNFLSISPYIFLKQQFFFLTKLRKKLIKTHFSKFHNVFKLIDFLLEQFSLFRVSIFYFGTILPSANTYDSTNILFSRHSKLRHIINDFEWNFLKWVHIHTERNPDRWYSYTNWAESTTN